MVPYPTSIADPFVDRHRVDALVARFRDTGPTNARFSTVLT